MRGNNWHQVVLESFSKGRLSKKNPEANGQKKSWHFWPRSHVRILLAQDVFGLWLVKKWRKEILTKNIAGEKNRVIGSPHCNHIPLCFHSLPGPAIIAAPEGKRAKVVCLTARKTSSKSMGKAREMAETNSHKRRGGELEAKWVDRANISITLLVSAQEFILQIVDQNMSLAGAYDSESS